MRFAPLSRRPSGADHPAPGAAPFRAAGRTTITRGRGVSVHRADCASLLASGFERRIEVEWDRVNGEVHPVGLVVVCANIKGMLAAISGTLSNLDINILEANIRTRVDNRSECKFVVEVHDSDHLSRALAAVRNQGRTRGLSFFHPGGALRTGDHGHLGG